MIAQGVKLTMVARPYLSFGLKLGLAGQTTPYNVIAQQHARSV